MRFELESVDKLFKNHSTRIFFPDSTKRSQLHSSSLDSGQLSLRRIGLNRKRPRNNKVIVSHFHAAAAVDQAIVRILVVAIIDLGTADDNGVITPCSCNPLLLSEATKINGCTI